MMFGEAIGFDSALFDVIAALAVRSALLLALGWLGASLLKHAAPPARQALWASVLAGVLLLPLLVAILPAWRVLPAMPRPARAPVVGGEAAGMPAPDAAARILSFIRAEGAEAAGLGTLERFGWDWRRSVLFLWGAGSALAAFIFALGLVRLRGIRRRGRPAPAATAQLAVRLARELGVRRPVRVLTVAGPSRPATWGLLRPVIVLPVISRRWSSERRHLVLAHEMAHIARYDFAWRLAAQLGCVTYWFNPLVWLAARRLRLEQELACDLAVVSRGTRPSTYAHHLLSIARAAGGRPLPLVALDLTRRSQMEGRLMSILENCPGRSSRCALLLPALAVLLALPVLAAAGTQPAPIPELPEAPVAPAAPSPSPVVAAPAASPAPVSAPSPVVAALAPVAPAAGLAATAPVLALAPPRAPQATESDPEIRRIEEEIARRAEEINDLVAPLNEEIARTMEEQIEPLLEQMDLMELELRPVQEEMSRIGEEMSEVLERELDTHVEAEELQRRAEELALEAEQRARISEALLSAEGVERERLEQALRESQASLEPLREEMEALRTEMTERYRASADEIRAQLEPQRAQMEALRERMRPDLERMEQLRVELEPIRQQLETTRESRMAEIRERLEALRQELEELQREREAMRPGDASR